MATRDLSWLDSEGDREDSIQLCCFDSNHWTRYRAVIDYFRCFIGDELVDHDLLKPRPLVYMVRFVDLSVAGHPTLYKYVGSTMHVARRLTQHLESVWTGDSKKNGSLLMTSVGHSLLRRFSGDLRFFKVEILKRDNLPDDYQGLHQEERSSMIAQTSFAMYGCGGLNVIDPVTSLWVLNGGVSFRHLQQIVFQDSWTCADVVNEVILPRTMNSRKSYHDYLEFNGDPVLRDAYRTVPDFFVAPTCTTCLWKDLLHYLQSKATTSREVKQGDQRPKFLHDAGDLYVHLTFLAGNLHKDQRPWPFALSSRE